MRIAEIFLTLYFLLPHISTYQICDLTFWKECSPNYGKGNRRSLDASCEKHAWVYRHNVKNTIEKIDTVIEMRTTFFIFKGSEVKVYNYITKGVQEGNLTDFFDFGNYSIPDRVDTIYINFKGYIVLFSNSMYWLFSPNNFVCMRSGQMRIGCGIVHGAFSMKENEYFVSHDLVTIFSTTSNNTQYRNVRELFQPSNLELPAKGMYITEDGQLALITTSAIYFYEYSEKKGFTLSNTSPLDLHFPGIFCKRQNLVSSNISKGVLYYALTYKNILLSVLVAKLLLFIRD